MNNSFFRSVSVMKLYSKQTVKSSDPISSMLALSWASMNFAIAWSTGSFGFCRKLKKFSRRFRIGLTSANMPSMKVKRLFAALLAGLIINSPAGSSSFCSPDRNLMRLQRSLSTQDSACASWAEIDTF